MRATLVLLLLSCLLPASGRAAPLCTQQKAYDQLYDRARALNRQSRHPEAAETLKEAHALCPQAALLRIIGDLYRFSKQVPEALDYYGRYLQTGPSAENRAAVQNSIGEMQKVSEQRALEKRLQQAERTIEEQQREEAERRERELREQRAQAALLRGILTQLTAAARPSADRPRDLHRKWWLWTTVGVLAAGAAAGITIGVLRQGQGGASSDLGTISVFQ
jgi:tetratricopeptide (TPR) repeat protein